VKDMRVEIKKLKSIGLTLYNMGIQSGLYVYTKLYFHQKSATWPDWNFGGATSLKTLSAKLF